MKSVVSLENLNHFDIKQILESGQVFRYHQLSNRSYELRAKGKVIKITQQQDSTTALIEGPNLGEVEEIWSDYFDIGTDYEAITNTLSQKDPHIAKAIDFGKGIRILKQDPWEMIISFIISQNKQIPHIQQCIENVCESFGIPIEEGVYAFPTPDQLSLATEEELRACKVGFRAPYIMDACQKICEGKVVIKDLYALPTLEAKQSLLQIKGIGEKVADCILLFGFSKTNFFPTDVWIKRVVEGLYFNGEEIGLQKVQDFAKQHFGELAGYAQQYLFFYGRELALFKKAK